MFNKILKIYKWLIEKKFIENYKFLESQDSVIRKT